MKYGFPALAQHRNAPKTSIKLSASAIVIAALTGLSFPACAQNSGQNQDTSVTLDDKKEKIEKIEEKRVTVDAEDATLAGILTTLMQSVGASYTLDNSLRTVRITAHLHNLRLDTTLAILLRSSTPAATYRVEESVYQFSLKPTASDTPVEPERSDAQQTPGGVKHLQVVRVNFIDAAEVARLLGGLSLRGDGQTYGLIDPNKFAGIVGGNGTTGAPGTNDVKGAPANGQGATVPANFLDYLWIVNAGAGF